MEKKCPHCGADLPREAAFCPHCAQKINERREVSPPRRMSGRALYSAAILLVAATALLLLALWVRHRPRVYDNGNAEVIYTIQGTDYQLCIAWANDPFTPAHERYGGGAPLDETFRYPVLLYINLADSETFAAEPFLEQVDSITAQVDGLDEDLQMTCAQPVQDTDYVPNTAAIVYVNFIVTDVGQHSAELTISVQMKNGDTIRLHQPQYIEGYMTHDYTAEDAPMDTVQDLEALLEQIAETVAPEDEVNIHLPPVTYTEEFVLEGRPVNLIGSENSSGARTTFIAPIRVTMEREDVLMWENMDFIGPGAGTGLSLSARVHLTNCRVAGWDTGVLAHAHAWVKADESVFENNTVGFHFNAESGNPSDSRFISDTFRSNGTALLLEQVPNKLTFTFPGCRFTANDTNIDNRCGQSIDISEAVFE